MNTFTRQALVNQGLYFLFSGQAVEAEGNDRPDMDLPGQQRQLLKDAIQYSKYRKLSIIWDAFGQLQFFGVQGGSCFLKIP